MPNSNEERRTQNAERRNGELRVTSSSLAGDITASLRRRFSPGAGLKPLVLERADRVGGCAITEEIAPGFQMSGADAPRGDRSGRDAGPWAAASWFEDSAAGSARRSAPGADGRWLTLWADGARAGRSRRSRHAMRNVSGLSGRSRGDQRSLTGAAAAAAPPWTIPARDFITLLKAGRGFRALGRTNAYRLLRWLPMAVADLAQEWFESEPLRAVAAGGVLGSSAGLGRPAARQSCWPSQPEKGGPLLRAGRTQAAGAGAISAAIAAAREAGAEIRTRRRRAAVWLVGVQLASGVVLRSDRSTVSRVECRSPGWPRSILHLTPEFVGRLQRIRMRGTVAKVNFALSGLPRFKGLAAADESVQQRPFPVAYASLGTPTRWTRAFDAAKDGGFADEPWIELAIPSIADRIWRLPAGTCCRRAQFAPALRGTTWDLGGNRLGDAATRTIATFAPGVRGDRPRAARDHTARPRANVWPDGRSPVSWRACDRSAAERAAVARLGTSPYANPQLVPVWIGHAPGHRRLDGPPARFRRQRDSQSRW